MASSAEPKPDHLQRTAAAPRDKSLSTVVLRKVDEINDQIRLFRLEIPKDGPPVRFLPGQWLDVFVPGIKAAGGFTITSSPADARPTAATTDESVRPGYLELAVQKSPENPPAAWLWQPVASILDAELRVRIGGSFVWPPPGINVRLLRRVVFISGGVGINPLVSMLGSLARAGAAQQNPFEVQFLYSIKDPGAGAEVRDASRMLFLERLATVFAEQKVRGRLRLFLTGGEGAEGGGVVSSGGGAGDVAFQGRRITVDDVAEAVGAASERRFAVVYVCGVPAMNDEFVKKLTDRDGGLGMEPHRVLCEKWW
ncbi:Uu.00g091620.m01.CDS01 [Anthostomella pinea]|uniref:Uu.00g091620.m01.CDS01 n=1 Tax=Anthostomella pinea TaxID=933095 RepID=A0AAI8VP24_9PEZI|nr:Uu.00g091620.m01.CDS01 [Anthostomella pinea]